MPKRTKRRKLNARVFALEKKVAQLDREMHPTEKELADALWDALQYVKSNPTPIFANRHNGAAAPDTLRMSDAGDR